MVLRFWPGELRTTQDRVMNGDVCADESLSRPKPSRFLLLFRGKGCRIVRWGSAPTIWQVSLRAKTDAPPLRSGQSPSAEVITRHLRDMARACASFNRRDLRAALYYVHTMYYGGIWSGRSQQPPPSFPSFATGWLSGSFRSFFFRDFLLCVECLGTFTRDQAMFL